MSDTIYMIESVKYPKKFLCRSGSCYYWDYPWYTIPESFLTKEAARYYALTTLDYIIDRTLGSKDFIIR